MAVFRAVENRRYLVRAANTGISAIVTPDGEIVNASPLFSPAVGAGVVEPVAEVSVYTRYGDVFAWGAVAVSISAGLVSIVARRHRANAAARNTTAPAGSLRPLASLPWDDRRDG
jgi:apolipoprotein N-acyltransferase